MVACLTKPDRAAARFVAAVILLLASQPGAVAAEWLEQSAGFSAPSMAVWSLDAVDENIAWLIAAGSLEFSRTTDGGSTWIPGTLPVTGSQATAITALDASTAWVAIKQQTLLRAHVHKTTDGGTTWVRQTTLNGFGWINAIHFFDANSGVAMGDPSGGYFEIFTTTNGGTNWTRVPSANIPPPLPSEYWHMDVYYGRGDTVWFGTTSPNTTDEGRVFRSTDRGVHWTVATIGFSGLNPITCVTGVAFRDQDNGLAVGHEHMEGTHKAARTTDGGLTWTPLDGPATPCPCYLAWVPGAAMYITTNEISGFQGGVGSAYSADDGESWTLIDQIPHGTVDFAVGTAGWCGGLTFELGGCPLPSVGPASAACCPSKRIAGGSPEVLRTERVILGGVWKWAESAGVGEASPVPAERLVHRGYPNPFNPAATIEFTLPRAGLTRLRVYTSAGQEVATLVEGSLAAGPHQAHWDAAGKASGVYFYRLEASGGVSAGRLVLAK